jgi:hypothetical protein
MGVILSPIYLTLCIQVTEMLFVSFFGENTLRQFDYLDN